MSYLGDDLDIGVINSIVHLAKESHRNDASHRSQQYWLICKRCGHTKGKHFAGFCKIESLCPSLTDKAVYDRFQLDVQKSIIATAIYILHGGKICNST